MGTTLRWTILLLLAGVLFLPSLQADEPKADSADAAKEAAGDEDGSDAAATEPAPTVEDELALRQSRIADRYRRLEQLMDKMAQIDAGSNPRRAALLQRAFKQSRDELVLLKLEKLVKLLEEDQLSRALGNQKKVRVDLKALLDLLQSEDRHASIKSEQARVREYIKELERIRRKQQGQRGRTEEGADDAQRLAKEQGDLARRTGDLGKQIGENEGDGDNKEDSEGDSKGDSEGDSKGDSEGDSKGDSEGDSKGDSEGDSKGDSEGDSKGESEGDSKGDSEGDSKGDSEGDSKGDSEGDSKGDSEGDSKGDSEGDSKGDSEGDSKGDSEGDSKGDSEGDSKGDSEGDSKGDSEGDSKGDSEGDSKGDSEGDSKGNSQGDSKGDSQGGESPPSPPSDEPFDQTRKRIQAAEENMRRAQEKLEDAKRKDAVEQQRKAEEELAKAIAELEEILRQLREEEIERMLALLEARFQKMLEMQLKVYEDTKRYDKLTKQSPGNGPEGWAGRLSASERRIVIEADKALTLLQEEGSSIAFPEVVGQMRDDMQQVTHRLADSKVGFITQGIEEDIIEALEEMIEALQKAQKEMEEGDPPPPGPPGPPQDQPLVDAIAELKMIKSLQIRVNRRTKRYAELLDDVDDPVGQATEKELVDALQGLSEREQRIYRITRDIVLGKNK